MSIDVDWSVLDTILADDLINLLNQQLEKTTRPSFIGPVEVLSFEFGKTAPSVDIVDVREIYRDFLEDDDDDEPGPDHDENGEAQSRSHPTVVEEDDDDEGFEWVSRNQAGRGMSAEGPAYHHMPPHMRYGRGPSAEFFGGMAGITRTNMWQGGMASVPNLRDLGPIFPASPGPLHLSFSAAAGERPTPSTSSRKEYFDSNAAEKPGPPSSIDENESLPPDPSQPDVQFHFRIEHHSDIRLTLTTSMLINYPSPMFMALPIKLSVTGIVFNGEVVVAYEGSRKRIHLCIVDDMNPYGPIGYRVPSGRNSADHTPPDPDGPLPHRSPKPLPIGIRLLPSIFIESEIGQADKHVLKNVTRVERFIQDIIRKTLEDELVFPNFHTLVLS